MELILIILMKGDIAIFIIVTCLWLTILKELHPLVTKGYSESTIGDKAKLQRIRDNSLELGVMVEAIEKKHHKREAL